MTPSTLELQRALESTMGRIARIERKECPYYSSYQIEELKVLLADGAVLELVFKNLSPQAILESARAKPDFLYNPLREIETYRTVLSGRSLGTAHYFGVATEEGRYWLFLERVAGAHLWQTGDLEAWRNAARWLARLHQQPVSMSHLICYDRTFYAQCWQRAAALDPGLLAIQSAHERAVECLLKLPSTFIHGDFYASNVLVQGERICPIDWELAGCGPGMIDLAALTAGKWDEEQRIDFLSAYCGGAKPSDAMRHALDSSRLHLAVRLLGWAADWRPPAAHAQDWRKEALLIAEGLA